MRMFVRRLRRSHLIFVRSGLCDPLGELFDVLAFAHGYGLQEGELPPA